MKTVLGLGGSIHDYASCLIQGKEIVVAIEDERLTRIRYAVASENPCLPSLNYCLKAANMTISDIDLIAMNDDLEEISVNYFKGRDTCLYNHHLTHAYSTFFTSFFEKSAILIIDGAGSRQYLNSDCDIRETTTYACGIDNNIQVLSRI